MVHFVDILTYDGCVASCVFGYADLFDTANRLLKHQGKTEGGFAIRIISLKGGPIRTSTNFTINTERVSNVHSPSEILLIPGFTLSSPTELSSILSKLTLEVEYLRLTSPSKLLLAASCSGVFLLGKAELLNALEATTTWWLAEAFQRLFPEVILDSKRLLVDEDKIVTAAAGASYHDLALHIIARYEGANLARLCARYMVIEDNRVSQQPYVIPWHFSERSPLIERADAWVRSDVAHHNNVSDLADYLGMNARTMGRHFIKLCGSTPQVFIKKIRLERAQTLLETTTAPTAQIGFEVGYTDETAFRRAFISSLNLSPSQYRKKFRNKA